MHEYFLISSISKHSHSRASTQDFAGGTQFSLQHILWGCSSCAWGVMASHLSYLHHPFPTGQHPSRPSFSHPRASCPHFLILYSLRIILLQPLQPPPPSPMRQHAISILPEFLTSPTIISQVAGSSGGGSGQPLQKPLQCPLHCHPTFDTKNICGTEDPLQLQ